MGRKNCPATGDLPVFFLPQVFPFFLLCFPFIFPFLLFAFHALSLFLSSFACLICLSLASSIILCATFRHLFCLHQANLSREFFRLASLAALFLFLFVFGTPFVCALSFFFFLCLSVPLAFLICSSLFSLSFCSLFWLNFLVLSCLYSGWVGGI